VSTDAIAVSIRRYSEKLSADSLQGEKTLLKLLENAQVSLKSGITDITFPKGELKKNGVKPLHTMSGSTADTLIIKDSDIINVDTSSALEIRKNLVEISIITDPSVEQTLGFVQYATGLLSENNINIVEVLSCYTDTIFIVEKEDATKAYEILSKK